MAFIRWKKNKCGIRQAFGKPKTTVIGHKGPKPLDHGWYSWFERAWEEGHQHPVFAQYAADLAPYIRQVLA